VGVVNIRVRASVLKIGVACALLIGAPLSALAQAAAVSPTDLAGMGLEELLRITVTTASKRSESLFDAPAIMAVLGEDDIHSYGDRSLVEVLDRTRRVPMAG
jgi:hypothetical protein